MAAALFPAYLSYLYFELYFPQMNLPSLDSNFAILLHFAHLMQFPQLRQQLETFLETEFNGDLYRLNDENLIGMIVEAKEAGFSESLVEVIYTKLGQLGQSRVNEVPHHFPLYLAQDRAYC